MNRTRRETRLWVPHFFTNRTNLLTYWLKTKFCFQPENLQPERHGQLINTIRPRINEADVVVPVKPIKNLPDLSDIKLGRHECFSDFNRIHLEYANKLISILLGESNITTHNYISLSSSNQLNVVCAKAAFTLYHRMQWCDQNLFKRGADAWIYSPEDRNATY